MSVLEKELSEDGVIPDKPDAIDTRLQEVQVIICPSESGLVTYS